jgi:hypothetical protein
MNRPNADPDGKLTGLLRGLLRAGLDALEERLAGRMEQWMRRAPFRRCVKKRSGTVTLHPEDYREVP